MVCRRLAFAVSFCVLALICLTRPASAFSPRYELLGKAELAEVESSNLLRFRMADQKRTATVRLLGVGSPNNRDRVKGLNVHVTSYIKDTDFSGTSREYVRSLLEGTIVEIWARKFDQYDEKHRLLVYVRIPAKDREIDLNGEIIRNGMGFVTRDYVHVTFVDYRRFEEEARRNHRGLWRGLLRTSLSSK
jgi:endonuclease YncB( thermonuclease family)